MIKKKKKSSKAVSRYGRNIKYIVIPTDGTENILTHAEVIRQNGPKITSIKTLKLQ